MCEKNYCSGCTQEGGNMKTEKQRPARQETQRGSIINSDTGKVKPKLSIRQEKVVKLLQSRKCSAADISIALGYSDPRSYVRDLKAKGLNIINQWLESDGVRYKVYWIEEPEAAQPKRETTKGVKEQSDFLDLFEKQHHH